MRILDGNKRCKEKGYPHTYTHKNTHTHTYTPTLTHTRTQKWHAACSVAHDTCVLTVACVLAVCFEGKKKKKEKVLRTSTP